MPPSYREGWDIGGVTPSRAAGDLFTTRPYVRPCSTARYRTNESDVSNFYRYTGSVWNLYSFLFSRIRVPTPKESA
jgi:hypothetical protein